MDFRFENPPQLELGQPIGYYREQFNKELHDSSFPGCERFMGRVTLGGAERVVDLGLADGKVVLFSLQILDGDTLDGVSLGLSPREFHERMRIEDHDSSIFSERLIFFEDSSPSDAKVKTSNLSSGGIADIGMTILSSKKHIRTNN